MDTIKFTDENKNEIWIPKEKIEFRPSAYGLITHEDKILLTVMNTLSHYSLPGGAVEKGETLQEALAREVKEESGLDAEVGELLFTKELNFYYAPLDKAWQVFAFFFRASVTSFDIQNTMEEGSEIEKSLWVPISNVTETDFKFAGEILRYIKKD